MSEDSASTVTIDLVKRKVNIIRGMDEHGLAEAVHTEDILEALATFYSVLKAVDEKNKTRVIDRIIHHTKFPRKYARILKNLTVRTAE